MLLIMKVMVMVLSKVWFRSSMMLLIMFFWVYGSIILCIIF